MVSNKLTRRILKLCLKENTIKMTKTLKLLTRSPRWWLKSSLGCKAKTEWTSKRGGPCKLLSKIRLIQRPTPSRIAIDVAELQRNRLQLILKKPSTSTKPPKTWKVKSQDQCTYNSGLSHNFNFKKSLVSTSTTTLKKYCPAQLNTQHIKLKMRVIQISYEHI